MSTIEVLKRVLSQIRSGEQPVEADLIVLEDAVRHVEARKEAAGGARKPGRPKGAKNRDPSPNNEREQARIELVMQYLELVDAKVPKGEAGIRVTTKGKEERERPTRTLDRYRKRYERIARVLLEDDAAFESVAAEMSGFERPDAGEEFSKR